MLAPRSSSPVLVVGASARAAVQSLARAGLPAAAIDLFGDRDMRLIAPVRVCPPEAYPDGFPSIAAEFPPGPVMYTGGLENYPHVIEKLAGSRPLWGNPPEVLARVRDPHALAALAQGKVRSPRLIPPGDPAPADGRRLRKPLRSSAGHGIRFATPGEPASAGHYLQDFIPGPSFSALFASGEGRSGEQRQTSLLGFTEQLIGEPLLHARPFAYCGNIGPVSLTAGLEAELIAFEVTLADTTGLQGLWGIDFIVKDDVAYVLEVNPRYSAGVEVLELGMGMALIPGVSPLATFVRPLRGLKAVQPERSSVKLSSRRGRANVARGGASAASATPGIKATSLIVGKAIYYTPRTIHFPMAGPWEEDLAIPFDPWRVPGFADIPEAGVAIEQGSPVITVFATGYSAEEVRRGLQSRVQELDRLLAEAAP